jgi:anti-anti-sigma regulatory factor
LVRQSQGALHLAGVGEKVKSLFVMSQLIKILTIHPNAQEAVDELNKT